MGKVSVQLLHGSLRTGEQSKEFVQGGRMKGWDSRRVIGDIKSRYSEWDTRSTRNPTGRNLYAAFYNGWLEGRLDMLQEIEKDLVRNGDSATREA